MQLLSKGVDHMYSFSRSLWLQSQDLDPSAFSHFTSHPNCNIPYGAWVSLHVPYISLPPLANLVQKPWTIPVKLAQGWQWWNRKWCQKEQSSSFVLNMHPLHLKYSVDSIFLTTNFLDGCWLNSSVPEHHCCVLTYKEASVLCTCWKGQACLTGDSNEKQL